MQCPACQYENREGRRFCGHCGSRLPVACPSCGTVDEDGERFCGRCGAELAAPAPPARAVPDRAPRDYTPKHLVEKILYSKSVIEGERKQVTVLFADVKGSLELAGQVDPEERIPNALEDSDRRLLQRILRHFGERTAQKNAVRLREPIDAETREQL